MAKMERKPLRMAKTKVFGATPVNTLVASGSDLSDQLKVVFRMPAEEESTLGDVVQLIRPQPNYVEGHYYQLREVDGSNVWVDISNSVPYGSQYGNGFYAFVGYRLFLVWADPPGVEGQYEWSRSEVYIRDMDADQNSGERMLLVSNEINAYAKDANAINITMGYDAESDFNPDSQHLILRTYFTDTTTGDRDYTESRIVPFTVDQSSLLAFQSDWNETDPKSANYIRNKPIVPTEFFVDDNGDLSYRYVLNGDTFTRSIGHVKDVTGFYVKDNIVRIREGLENGPDSDASGPHALQLGMRAIALSSVYCDDGRGGVEETTWQLEFVGEPSDGPNAEERSPASYFKAGHYVTISVKDWRGTVHRFVDVGIISEVIGDDRIVINHRDSLSATKIELADSLVYPPGGTAQDLECYMAPTRPAGVSDVWYGWNGEPPPTECLAQMTKFGTAFGAEAMAHANGALAAGFKAVAAADLSWAIGCGVYNLQPGTTVVGAWNEIVRSSPEYTGNGTSFSAHMVYPFVVGIGTSNSDRKDGFRVRMDGSVFIRGINSKVGLISPHATCKMLAESFNKAITELGAVDQNGIQFTGTNVAGVISGITVGADPDDEVIAVTVGSVAKQRYTCKVSEGLKFVQDTSSSGDITSEFPFVYVPSCDSFFLASGDTCYAYHGIPGDPDCEVRTQTIHNTESTSIAVCTSASLGPDTTFLMVGPDILSPEIDQSTEELSFLKVSGIKSDGSEFTATSKYASACMDVDGSGVFVTICEEISNNSKCALYYSNYNIDSISGQSVIKYDPCTFIVPPVLGDGEEVQTGTLPGEFIARDLKVVTDINGDPVMLASFDINYGTTSVNDAYVLYSTDGSTWRTMSGLPRGLYNSAVALDDGKVLVPSLKGTGMWYTEDLTIIEDGKVSATWKQVAGVTSGNWKVPTKLRLSNDLSVYVATMDLTNHAERNNPKTYAPGKIIVSENGIDWFWTDLVLDATVPAVVGSNVLIPVTDSEKIVVFSIEEFTSLVKQALDLGKDKTRIVLDHLDEDDPELDFEALTKAYNKLVDAHNQLARSV